MRKVDIYSDNMPMFVNENKAWVVTSHNNLLFEISIDEWSCRFVNYIGGTENCWRGFFVASVIDEYIICLPQKGSTVVLVERSNGNLLYINIPGEKKDNWVFSNCIIDGDSLYTFSVTYNCIIKMDLQKKEIVFWEQFNDINVRNVCVNGSTFVFLGDDSKENRLLYQYDVVQKQLRLICENGIDQTYSQLNCNGNNCYISGNTYDLLQYNIESKKCIKYEVPKDVISKNYGTIQENNVVNYKEILPSRLFINHISSANYNWYIPMFVSHILRIDIDSGQLKIIMIDDENEIKERRLEKKANMSLEFIYNGMLVVYSHISRCHYFIDLITGEILRKKHGLLLLDEQLISNRIDWKQLQVCEENEIINLESFISSIERSCICVKKI